MSTQADAEFVRAADDAQRAYATAFVVCCVSLASRDELERPELLGKVVGGVSTHLDSTRPSDRADGVASASNDSRVNLVVSSPIWTWDSSTYSHSPWLPRTLYQLSQSPTPSRPQACSWGRRSVAA